MEIVRMYHKNPSEYYCNEEIDRVFEEIPIINLFPIVVDLCYVPDVSEEMSETVFSNITSFWWRALT